MAKTVIYFMTLFCLFAGISDALATQLPDPGEIARLKESGEWEKRRKFVEELGNHKIKPHLLERLRKNLKLPVAQSPDLFMGTDTHMAPPPGWRGMPTSGNIKTFALLIDFPDYPSTVSQANIHSKLFGDGIISEVAPPYESLRNYYLRSSYGLLDLSGGTTLGWYRSPSPRSSIEMTTRLAGEQLIKDALAYFDAMEHDFSQYDNDNDGTIDYFMVIWTGPEYGWGSIWGGHETNFSDSSFHIDGKSLNEYSWQAELDSRGTEQTFSPRTVIHETGHALGLPDLYDYDDTEGPKGGVGGLDMMHGSLGDHNCFSKWVLGWLTPTVISSGSKDIALNPSGTHADAVVIMPGATSTDPFREMFMVQNMKRNTGNDPSHFPNDGLLIWHIDASLDSNGYNYLYDNSFTPRKLVKLVQADGLDEIENLQFADADDYFVPGKEFTPITTPSSKTYLGVDSRVNITNIVRSGNLLNATFSIDPVSQQKLLTVFKAGTGNGVVSETFSGISCGSDCVESYQENVFVTLTAAAAPGCQFVGWSGGCSGTGDCSLTMNSDVTVTANFADLEVPVVKLFEITESYTSAVWIYSFDAVDNIGVTSYCITETDSSSGCIWTASALRAYYVTSPPSQGTETRTLYAWVKDAVGNISAGKAATVILKDTTAPYVTAFSVQANVNSSLVTVTTFFATDNFGITGYLITETATLPSASSAGWTSTAPASYAVSSAGAKTLYLWAKDAVGNISAGKAATVILKDTSVPFVTAFSVQANVNSSLVTVITFFATDNFGITGYLITETATPPSASSAGWTSTVPASYTVSSAGAKTLYAWAKDAAGNVSASASATVSITVHSGDLTGDGKVDTADALKALQIAVGVVTQADSDLLNGDVAPLGDNGLPAPDGKIDVGDALIILKEVVGLIGW